MDDPDLDALQEYYAQGRERDRLTNARGVVELERTKEIVLRHLPPAPAGVADIGGGAGCYSLWLAGRGHRVVHRDIVPLHVEQLRDAAADLAQVDTAVGDARALDLDDDSVDAVLLLGPLYHLRHRGDRLTALREAARIVRPGGPVFVAAISRWAPRLDGLVNQRLYATLPAVRDLTPRVERSGWMPPILQGAFLAYVHRPGQLRAEVRAAGLRPLDLVGVEGLAFMLPDLAERLADPEGRAVVFDAARAIERVPELLGAAPHLLATAVRPQL